MSELDPQDQAKELGRLWQHSVMPMEDESAVDHRRERVVPAIGDAILRASQRRQRERGRRGSTIVLAVAATLAVAVGARHWSHHRDVAAKLVEAPLSNGVRAMTGTVTLSHGSESAIVLRAAFALGDTLSTAALATAEVKLTNLVVADLGASSEVSLVTPRASTHRLRLDHGELRAHVNDRPSSTPKLVVETPNVDVVVTGTIFEVDVTKDANQEAVTTVSVTKGRIVVRRAGTDVAAVTAGQSWSSKALTPENVAPVRTETPHVLPAKRATASAPSGAPAKVAVTAVASAAFDDSNGTLTEENSLFQAAMDAHSRGDDYAAITRLTELLGQYPASPLGAEARVERMRALKRTGHVLEAARDAKRYLTDYPSGFAAEEARGLLSRVEASE